LIQQAYGSVDPGDAVFYTYDDNGSLIKKIVADKDEADPDTNFSEKTIYTYNLQNRLAEIKVTTDGSNWDVTTYEYNPDGIRIKKDVDGTVTNYLIDSYNHTGYAQTFIEDNGTNTTCYVIGDDVLAQAVNSDDPEYLLYDGHGSTRQLAGSDGVTISDNYSYDAYGVMLGGNPAQGSSPATSLLYAGEQFDTDAQQYYLRARYYDPLNGRFNRVDPYSGNTQDPQSLHKYLYAYLNPVNNIDPTGRFSIVITIAIVVLAVFLIGMPIYHWSLTWGKRNGSCGKDVTAALTRLYSNLEDHYNNRMDEAERNRRCNRMYSGDGWDIYELFFVDSTLAGTDDCEATVKVNGNCYSVYEVNYFLWGAMNKLCGESLFVAKRFAWTWATYEAPWNTFFMNYQGTAGSKTNWTTVGYKNDFGRLKPHKSQFNKCDCASSTVWADDFTYNWGNDPRDRDDRRRRRRR
jgi:RHS repeat-associated protein